jgi:hypothetical protein
MDLPGGSSKRSIVQNPGKLQRFCGFSAPCRNVHSRLFQFKTTAARSGEEFSDGGFELVHTRMCGDGVTPKTEGFCGFLGGFELLNVLNCSQGDIDIPKQATTRRPYAPPASLGVAEREAAPHLRPSTAGRPCPPGRATADAPGAAGWRPCPAGSASSLVIGRRAAGPRYSEREALITCAYDLMCI